MYCCSSTHRPHCQDVEAGRREPVEVVASLAAPGVVNIAERDELTQRLVDQLLRVVLTTISFSILALIVAADIVCSRLPSSAPTRRRR